MTSQLELIAPKLPKVNGDMVARLCAELKGGDWVTSRVLSWDGYSERELRAIANASKGAIITGQKGYKLNVEATEDERKHAANWLRHQAREMLRRADEIELFHNPLEIKQTSTVLNKV